MLCALGLLGPACDTAWRIFDGQWYRWRGVQNGSGRSTPTGTRATAVGTSTPTLSRTRTGGTPTTRSCLATLFFPRPLIIFLGAGFLIASLCAIRRPFFPRSQRLLQAKYNVFVRLIHTPTLFEERIAVNPYFVKLFLATLFFRFLMCRMPPATVPIHLKKYRQSAYLCQTVRPAPCCAGWGATRCRLSVYAQ